MRALRRTASGLFAGTLLLLAGDAAADSPLRISGTGTALGTMHRLAEAFAAESPGQRVQVLPSVGSSGAFKAAARGALDIGVSARPLKADEYGLGLVAVPYARTPFLFAAGPRTGVTTITAAEVSRIYAGHLAAWPNGEPVRVILRPHNDADTQILLGISPQIAAAVRESFRREGMLMAGTNQECNERLVRTPGAVAPSSLTQILTEGLKVTPLSWEGVAPTTENLAAGKYPLQKTLFLVLRAPVPPEVRRFVLFLSTPRAQRILEQTGNLPIPIPKLD